MDSVGDQHSMILSSLDTTKHTTWISAACDVMIFTSIIKSTDLQLRLKDSRVAMSSADNLKSNTCNNLLEMLLPRAIYQVACQVRITTYAKASQSFSMNEYCYKGHYNFND